MGFWPNANWNGENSCTLASEFFAFTHHERAKSKPVLEKRLCHSTNSLLEGDSAAVEINVMFIDSHMSKNVPFVNSPP